MKTLKLDHELAQLVEQGSKTSTWRLYDDKDLSVNDTVQLIDKVEPSNPATWKVIGVAHIDSIIQKRLGDITEEDYDGHEQFANPGVMLETYRRYYGPQVDMQTALKIIRFTFNNNEQSLESSDVKSTTNIKELKMYADGGSRGNPGPSASGYVLMDMDGRVVVKKGVYLGITTNNQAEYQALKLGLEEARAMGVRELHVYMDSLLVVNQMLGIFKVKNRDLWPVHTTIKEILKDFKHVAFTHVPRELNKLADAAVNETLDAADRPIKQEQV
jgi:ribonuclease HI